MIGIGQTTELCLSPVWPIASAGQPKRLSPSWVTHPIFGNQPLGRSNKPRFLHSQQNISSHNLAAKPNRHGYSQRFNPATTLARTMSDLAQVGVVGAPSIPGAALPALPDLPLPQATHKPELVQEPSVDAPAEAPAADQDVNPVNGVDNGDEEEYVPQVEDGLGDGLVLHNLDPVPRQSNTNISRALDYDPPASQRKRKTLLTMLLPQMVQFMAKMLNRGLVSTDYDWVTVLC